MSDDETKDDVHGDGQHQTTQGPTLVVSDIISEMLERRRLRFGDLKKPVIK